MHHIKPGGTFYPGALFVLLSVALTMATISWAALPVFAASPPIKLKTVVVADHLVHPWGFVFLPNGDILITERPGRLRRVRNGVLSPRPVGGLPDIKAGGQGGLLDIVLHPDYASNGWIYISYVAAGMGGRGTEVLRAKLVDNRLEQVESIFRLLPKSGTGHHFGSRLLFDNAGYLYITLGDRGERPRAQDLADHAGSIIRLHDDGRTPQDNPFVGRANAMAEIYSYGHRNSQGATLHPKTGAIWIHEHGPQGGDELNIIQAGANYGWPVITYGVNYGFGTAIGEGTAKEGMEQPIHYWVPSIAPSGVTFYSGDKFPEWQGDLFVGSLKFRKLVHLKIEGDRVIAEAPLLRGMLGRIRDVRNGPDGYLYLLTDESNGRLIRLERAKAD